MPAQDTLYHEVLDQIYMLTRKLGVRNTSIKRLGLLVLGIICSESCVIAKMAARLCAMGVTDASAPSVRRRLRRTLHDEKLEATLFYEPAVRQAIDWQALLKGSKRVFLIVDESSKEEQIQLLRVSLAYRADGQENVRDAVTLAPAGARATGDAAPPIPRTALVYHGPCAGR